jgi:hypothetical protein
LLYKYNSTPSELFVLDLCLMKTVFLFLMATEIKFTQDALMKIYNMIGMATG